MHPQSSFPRRRARPIAGLATTWLVVMSAVACSAPPQEPAAIDRQPIAGGIVDESHQNVFLLAWHEGQAAALCTATLIAPNLLLTARHCVSPSSGQDHVLCGDASLGEPRPAAAFFATNAAQPREGSRLFGASEVRVPASTVDTCGYDIALLILDENVPAPLSAPAVPRIDREAVPGELYTAVGYGVTESGEPSGSRMRLEGLSVECEPGSCGEGVESTEFRGETGICSGDSGGPALDADGKVLGVVSRGGPDCSTPVYGSVTSWRDFIVRTATDAAQLGGYEPAFWVTSGSSDPPPVVGAGTGTGGAPAEPNAALEGDSCENASECGPGLVCYQGAAVGVAHCAASCREASDCRDGMICVPAGSAAVCAQPADRGDESGCSISTAGASPSWGAMLAGVATALAAARRRHARARR